MRAQTIATLTALLLTLLTLPSPSAGAAETDASAETALKPVFDRYRHSTNWVERLDYQLTFPDGSQEDKRIFYGIQDSRGGFQFIGPDGAALFALVAANGRLEATQTNAPDAYVSGPYDGKLLAAYAEVGAAEAGWTPPPGFGAAGGGSFEEFVEAFGFGVLHNVRLTGVQTGPDGTQTKVTFEADGGGGELTLADGGDRITEIRVVAGPEGRQVRFVGTPDPSPSPVPADLFTLDITGRRAVTSFAELDASAYPLGDSAPTATAQTAGGEPFHLADQGGKVIVLDFWATWCVPCWEGLEQIEELVAWAEASGKPVEVWAVDTLERSTEPTSTRATALAFLEERGLELPVLFDYDHSFFAALHKPGLPSTVVVGPDGTLAAYHSGVSDNLAEELKAEILQLLE